MKKYLLLIGVIISLGFQAQASKDDVYMTIYKKSHVEKNTTVHRSPMLLPFDVYYDTETRKIEVVSDDEVAAQVYLYDGNGNTLDYSPCINAVLDVPNSYKGLIFIFIESENWTATGEIVV